jgi:hypothetical protein
MANLSTTSPRIYASMIAGSIPAFSMDIEAAIVKIAGAILQDYRLHTLYVRDEAHVFYYAVPSRLISHASQFETALAAAMPGHPDYQGDAIYALDIGMEFVAVIKQQGDFFLTHGDREAINTLADKHTLPIHILSTAAQTWPLKSAFGSQRKYIEELSQRIVRMSTLALGVGTLLYLALLGGEQYLKWSSKSSSQTQALADTIQRFEYTSPLFEQLAHFQKISATVVRSGGWIEGYSWKPGKDESFEIVMPGWISQDYIDSLGPGTVTEYNIPDNLVTARKGSIEKVGKQ